MAERPRILVLDGPTHQVGNLLQNFPSDWEVVHAGDAANGLALLDSQVFDGILADAHDPGLRTGATRLLQAEQFLEALPDGVAVVDPTLRVLWANPAFQQLCGTPIVGADFHGVLGTPGVTDPGSCPFEVAKRSGSISSRMTSSSGRCFALHISPIRNSDNQVIQLIVLCREVTAEMQRQQKLDVLHEAGRDLAALPAEHLGEMSVEERIELLKSNIRKLTHDLLHYDIIEIRLLDQRTGRLEPLLQEGVTPDAAGRSLSAREAGSGITGHVAHTGKTYVCRDTANDRLYLEGSVGARSSLTAPLIVQSVVIGTLNVENPRLNAFGDEDVQFLEILSREIAIALHTLQLLNVEKQTTASRSVEAISHEVALPVDDILAAATCALERYIGHDQDMADKLTIIVDRAREIKQAIQKVGENLAPASAQPRHGEHSIPSLRGLRVLVVDQDERVRRTAHARLGRFGCIVETAGDGQEAITMARLSLYDAILVDILLPDHHGYELYKKLKEARPNANVVMMSGYGYDPTHSIVKARQDGLKHVLFKPFRIDQLIEALASPEDAAGIKGACFKPSSTHQPTN